MSAAVVTPGQPRTRMAGGMTYTMETQEEEEEEAFEEGEEL